MNHSQWRSQCINILASENIVSPSIRSVLASDLTHRYSEWENHDISDRWDEGGDYVIKIEEHAVELAKKCFNAKFVELRPISGHIAILAAICAFTKPGGTNLGLGRENGAHGWYHFSSKNQVVNYTSDYLPFDTKNWNIDIDAAVKKIRTVKPCNVILGASFYLFPHPVQEISEAADEVNATVLYDGAHVLGLIGGKQWPNPLQLGADVLSGSTHKSFPGPQKGVLLTNDRARWLKAAEQVYPVMVTNHHLMSVAAFAYALEEFAEFGEEYSKQVVKNAKSLGKALGDQGFELVGEQLGFTESHQLLVKSDKIMQGRKAARLLNDANIICNRMELDGANGLRLGTLEITRLGMKESEMEVIARFMRKVIIDQAEPRTTAKSVEEFMKGYSVLRYSFDDGKNPYDFSN